jgi:hypothetical protein
MKIKHLAIAGIIIIFIIFFIFFYSGDKKESSSQDEITTTLEKTEPPILKDEFILNTDDSLMIKCKSSVDECRNRILKYSENNPGYSLPVEDLHILDMKKFETGTGLDDFFGKYKNEIQTTIGAEYGGIYPLVLIGIREDGVYISKINFCAVCDSNGELTENSRTKLLCY